MGTQHLHQIVRNGVHRKFPTVSSIIRGGRRNCVIHRTIASTTTLNSTNPSFLYTTISPSSSLDHHHHHPRCRWNSNHHHPSQQPFSSLSTKLWDVLQTGNLNPTNPLLDSISQGCQNLDYTRLAPHHFESAASHCQEEYETRLQSLEHTLASSSGGSTSPATYETVVVELHRIASPLVYLKNVIILLSMVKDDDSFRDALGAANETIQMMHERSPILFNALTRIEHDLVASTTTSTSTSTSSTSSSSPNNTERVRVVQSLLLKSKLNGTDSNVQKEVAQLTSRIAQLESKFHTLSSYTKEQHGKITSPRELLPYMYKILSLKKQRSQLLGYKNDAQMNLEAHNSMAGRVDTVRAIHDVIAERALERITDEEFISEQLRVVEDDSFLDDIRPYFELEHVLRELFGLCSSLFGIRIVEAVEEECVGAWHKDVRLFHVYDEDESDNSTSTADNNEGRRKIASFYLDPFRRKHKSSGGFVAPISFKHNHLSSNKDGGDAPPVESLVAICLNIRPEMWDDSTVNLDFQDVVTMFHEFGHALQHLLADVELGSFCGTQCIEEDASEIVSQFMEYWLFQGPLLAKLSKNPETGEPLPCHAIDRIERFRLSTKSLELSQRLFLGGLELEVNSNFDPLGDDSIVSLQREYAQRFCPHQGPSKGNIDPLIEIFQNNAEGKCTAQYRYLWSEIMSADAFEEFTDVSDGLNVEDASVKGVGTKFRRTFLEAGGAISTSDAYRGFRGREATMEPLLKMYGLS